MISFSCPNNVELSFIWRNFVGSGIIQVKISYL